MRATNDLLEQDMRQLPALVNKTFQLENNLLLRGKAAAGVWPKERFSERMEMEDVGGAQAAARQVIRLLGGGSDEPVARATGAVSIEDDQEEAAFQKRMRAGGRHQRLLVAGRYSLRVPSDAGTLLDAQQEDIVPDNLKGHLDACLADLSERVSGIRMPCDDDAAGDDAEVSEAAAAAEAAVAEGEELARRVIERFGISSQRSEAMGAGGRQDEEKQGEDNDEGGAQERGEWRLAAAAAAARASAAAAAAAEAATFSTRNEDEGEHIMHALVAGDVAGEPDDGIAGACMMRQVVTEGVRVSRSPGGESETWGTGRRGEELSTVADAGALWGGVTELKEGLGEVEEHGGHGQASLLQDGEHTGGGDAGEEEEKEEDGPLARARRLLAMLH